MVMTEGQKGRGEYMGIFETLAGLVSVPGVGHVSQWPSTKSREKRNIFYHHQAPPGHGRIILLCY